MSIASRLVATCKKSYANAHLFFDKVKTRYNLTHEVLACIALCPETQALFDAARKDGVHISFSHCEISGTGIRGRYSISDRKPRITLATVEEDGSLTPAVIIAASLADELRHYWQHKRIGVQRDE